MTVIFLIHGAYGNPAENWFMWLREELEKLGHEVIAPRFPTPEDQKLENWLDIFKNYEDKLDKEAIVIGHSLGATFLLNLLEKNKAKAMISVAGFSTLIDLQAFDEINESFIKDFDWKRIKANCKKIIIFHSDNDPYVPLEFGENLAKALKTKVILIKDAGHFNEKSGYTKFPQLLDKVISITS
ncbi:serine hydrolase family protein [Candidatus Woesearchaeota archaeon]|nr:serine hydrolase family protein [Candidatus Woesearchaeota archaeon]